MQGFSEERLKGLEPSTGYAGPHPPAPSRRTASDNRCMAKRARTKTGRRPERRQDPRLTAERIRAIDGDAVTEETWAVVVSPIELPDGRVLAFHGPQVVAFNLFEAQRHAGRGSKARRQLLGNLYRGEDEMWRMRDPRKGLDCVRELATAVLFAFTALEGLANHTIDQMEPEATVKVEREGVPVVVVRDRMERVLSVSEKLHVAIPAFTGRPSLKGDALWGKFVRLRRLRDALVHPKHRGSNPIHAEGPTPGPDPNEPGIYGMLMRGAADECADDAIALVRALRPDFIPPHVAKALRLEEAAPR